MTFEEFKAAHPIDGKRNVYYIVNRLPHKSYWYTERDKEILKEKFPFGYFYGEEYYYYKIVEFCWYDSYYYKDDRWYLGYDDWNGIVEAKEPKYHSNYKLIVCKTRQEALDYVDRKLDITSF